MPKFLIEREIPGLARYRRSSCAESRKNPARSCEVWGHKCSGSTATSPTTRFIAFTSPLMKRPSGNTHASEGSRRTESRKSGRPSIRRQRRNCDRKIDDIPTRLGAFNPSGIAVMSVRVFCRARRPAIQG